MPEATPFQVLVVDDHPLMRRGIRQLLELDPTFEVVAEAGDGATAIDQLVVKRCCCCWIKSMDKMSTAARV